MRAKDVFRKYCDSVLQKTAKVRSLATDLKKNYPTDETAQKSGPYKPLFPSDR